MKLNKEILDIKLATGETIEEWLNILGESVIDVNYKHSSISGNLKKFYAWTENYVVFMNFGMMGPVLDAVPRNPQKKG